MQHVLDMPIAHQGKGASGAGPIIGQAMFTRGPNVHNSHANVSKNHVEKQCLVVVLSGMLLGPAQTTTSMIQPLFPSTIGTQICHGTFSDHKRRVKNCSTGGGVVGVEPLFQAPPTHPPRGVGVRQLQGQTICMGPTWGPKTKKK